MFGIMISAWRGDVMFLRGLVSSIRAHSPDVPICIVKHGVFSTDDLVRYGVSVIEECDVSPVLRERSFGYGLTKMVSFWHSPFEKFMHIDADAVMCGDVLRRIPINEYDFIYNEAHEKIDDRIQKEQYFDPSLFDPGFDWRGCPYFNTGAFIATRGMFDIDEYIKLLQIQSKIRGSIFMDQGILNIMLFRGVEAGRFRVRDWPLQAIVPVLTESDLKKRFPFDGKAEEPRIVHWAGQKPYLGSGACYSALMTYHRRRHLRLKLMTNTQLRIEELHARYTAKHEGSYLRAIKSKMRYILSSG